MGWQDVKEFTIDRSKWARGGKNGPSSMLNEEGCMCCLGFYAKACGADNEDLRSCSYPGSTHNSAVRRGKTSPVASWLLEKEYTNSFGREIANINDARGNFEAEREKEIAAAFAKHGVTVRFVDGGGQ